MIPLTILISILLLISFSNAIIKTNYEIREESKVGTFIGHLSNKLSASVNTKYSYMMLNKEDASYFSVEKDTGRLTIAKRLDREQLCNDDVFNQSPEEIYQSSYNACKLTFTVNILNGTASFHDVMKVTVSVLDDDDNTCEFIPSNEQTLRIKENAEIRSIFPINSPQDNDRFPENNIKKHSIRIKSENGLNSLQNFNLQITPTNIKSRPYNLALILIEKLDYEDVKSFEIFIEAKDGTSEDEKHTCQLKVTVIVEDVNEFAPKFRLNDTEIKLLENTPISKPFYQLQAYDLDGGREFREVVFAIDTELSRNGVEEYFHVDPKTGELSLKKSLTKMYGNNFEIPFVAKNIGDNQLKDRITLTVKVEDVNDEKPMITLARLDGGEDLEIEEESRKLPLDFATITVTDGDSGLNGIVDCQLQGENSEKFQIQRLSEQSYSYNNDEPVDTIYKLSAIAVFDREMSPKVNFVIECTDKGTPSLTNRHNITVKIIDKNDNNPKFLKNHYEFMINEDSDPKRAENDFEIGRVEAIDDDVGLNAKLAYSISPESNVQNFFTIDKDSGIIVSNKNLNREVQDTFQFYILVSDQPRDGQERSSSVQVIVKVIDYNDEIPTFDQDVYEFIVEENAPVGQLVGSLTAEDHDIGLNGQLEFSLTPENPIFWKIQDNQMGKNEIPFKINSYYDSSAKKYLLNLQVSGEIDREKLLPGEDSLKSFSYDNYEYWTKQPETSYKFFITAKDLGNPSLIARKFVKIKVLDVNDQYPRFIIPSNDQDYFNISRNENVGFRIVTISAIDSDAGENGTVQYSIENIKIFMARNDDEGTQIDLTPISSGFGSDPSNYFSIDEISGDLKLINQFSSSVLLNTVFVVRIKASDRGYLAKVSEIDLKVFVDDSEPKIPTSNGSWNYLGTSSVLNFVIIVTIVAASCLISVILMTAIFVVLRKSKSYRPTSNDSQLNGNQICYDPKLDKYQEISNYSNYNHGLPLQTGTFARGNPMSGYIDDMVYNTSMHNGTIIRSPTMSTYHHNQNYQQISTMTRPLEEVSITGSNNSATGGGINSFLQPISIPHMTDLRLDSNFYGNLMETDKLINSGCEARSDSTMHGQSTILYSSNNYPQSGIIDQNINLKTDDLNYNGASISADGDSGHGDSLDTIQNQNQIMRPIHDMKAIPIYFQTINSAAGHQDHHINC